MLDWMMIVIMLGAGCAVLSVLCLRMRSRLSVQGRDEEAFARMEEQIRSLRGGEARLRREISGLRRALKAEREDNDWLERELEAACKRANTAELRASQAEARGMAAEKEASAGKMRGGILEKELAELEQAMRNQELMYQDILKEREQAMAALMEKQRSRSRKRPGALDQQITLEELLGNVAETQI